MVWCFMFWHRQANTPRYAKYLILVKACFLANFGAKQLGSIAYITGPGRYRKRRHRRQLLPNVQVVIPPPWEVITVPKNKLPLRVLNSRLLTLKHAHKTQISRHTQTMWTTKTYQACLSPINLCKSTYQKHWKPMKKTIHKSIYELYPPI